MVPVERPAMRKKRAEAAAGETSLVMSVPEAGRRYLGLKSKSAAYRAAAMGVIPTIQFGSRKIVPIAAMERVLAEAGKAR
jgi:hypothetical protein